MRKKTQSCGFSLKLWIIKGEESVLVYFKYSRSVFRTNLLDILLGMFFLSGKLCGIINEKAWLKFFSPSSNFLSHLFTYKWSMAFWIAWYILTALSFGWIRIHSSINILKSTYLIQILNVAVGRKGLHKLSINCLESFQVIWFSLEQARRVIYHNRE